MIALRVGAGLYRTTNSGNDPKLSFLPRGEKHLFHFPGHVAKKWLAVVLRAWPEMNVMFQHDGGVVCSNKDNTYAFFKSVKPSLAEKMKDHFEEHKGDLLAKLEAIESLANFNYWIVGKEHGEVNAKIRVSRCPSARPSETIVGGGSALGMRAPFAVLWLMVLASAEHG